TSASNVSGNAAATITVTANDGDGSGNVNLGTVNVNITGVNDAPTLTATGGNPTFVEGGAAQDLFNTVSASTIESGDTFTSMTLTVTNVSDGANEILSFDGSDVALTNGTMVTTATNGLSVSVSVTGSTATVSFSGGTLTSAQFQTLVDALTYRNTSDDPTSAGNRVVTITDISDSGGTANSGVDSATPNLASTVTVTPVNSAPAITGVDSESSTVISGDGATNVALFDDAAITDADSSDFNGGFITIAQNTGTTNGNWSVDGTTVTSGGDATLSAGETIQVNGVTVGTVDVTDDGQGGNDFTINFTTASADPSSISTLLQNLLYEGPSVVDARTFTLTLNDNDGTANSGDEDTTANFTINVSPNPPVIANLSGDSFTFTEGDDATTLDVGDNLTITDADSADFDGGDLTISITANQAAEDRLEIDTSGNISLSAGQTAGSTVSVSGTVIGTIDSGATGGSNEDLIISLNSNATPARVQELLREIQYNNADSNTPTDGDRTISITLSDGTGATSNAADVTVNVDPVNTNPVLDAALPTDLTFTEDTSSNVDLSSSTIGDLDSASITVTITANEGIFGTPTDGAGVGGGVTETLVNSTTITLVGSPADISTYLDTTSAITWTPATNDNGDNTSTFTVAANDGDGSGDVTLGTVNADVTAVNDIAVISGDDTLSITEDVIGTVSGDLNSTDPDNNDDVFLAETLDGSYGQLIIDTDGSWTYDVDETLAAVDQLTTGGSLDDTLTVETEDGTEQDIVITITGVDDDAVLSGDTSATISETGTSVSGTISLSDADDSDPVFADQAATIGDNAFGSFTLVTGPSSSTWTYEVNPSRVAGLDDGDTVTDIITYTASDTSTHTITVTITGVGEPEPQSTANDDNIQLTDEDDEITLLGGDDTVNAGNGDDTINAQENEDNNLLLNGGRGEDLINGGDGDDTLIGGEDSDTLNGGDGNDFIQLGDDEDPSSDIVGSRGQGGSGNDTIDGGFGNDTILGGGDDDEIDGDRGQDLLIGGQGSDTINAGRGDDLSYAGQGDMENDDVSGNEGDDTLGGGAGDDLINGGSGNDLLWGRQGNDTVNGGSGDDVIFNGEGNDTIDAGTGNDTLWGSFGNDTLTGGTGADHFVFGADSGNDRITDFDADEDIIELFDSAHNFADVDALLAAATEDADGVLLTLGDDQSIFIAGASLSDLSSSNITLL
ncbi:beta strand repeat-containing protein, partial [Kordiimonas laminariae]|uniref:beta strand repeat-containing protein n=1 Tax=Kordiimonas laminariae TaxID=2917717 RepID=UPI001FF5CE3C